jgi:hypothetical protein
MSTILVVNTSVLIRQVPADHGHLCATLALIHQKRARVLEVVALHISRQDSSVRHWVAVADSTSAICPFGTIRNGLMSIWYCQGQYPNFRPGRQGIRLQTGLPFQRDDLAGRQIAMRAKQHELLGDEADAVVRDNDDAEQAHGGLPEDEHHKNRQYPPESVEIHPRSAYPSRLHIRTGAHGRDRVSAAAHYAPSGWRPPVSSGGISTTAASRPPRGTER